jgi:hypothetical protein
MQVLMTGRGTSGSWQIRGVQLGRALGATAMPEARDVAPYDVVVLVKRPTPDLLQRIRSADVPLIWDVVDSWPQPSGNEWSGHACRYWLRNMVEHLQPAGIVAATQAMAEDLKALTDAPVLTLPHHARPGLRRNPIHAEVRTVGYEGGEQYITRWRPIIEAECVRRGWTFVTQPAELADVDIVLALRDATGYAPRSWKSNVKLANAQGSGTPIVCCREAGYLETQSCAEEWVDTPQELTAAFDGLTSRDARLWAGRVLYDATPHILPIADTYSKWLRLNFSAR